ncbi:hypothetical protein [Helicobacter burdigaliensis]|nr:hypothetical protein [Helicobacter burdigaliensis]
MDSLELFIVFVLVLNKSLFVRFAIAFRLPRSASTARNDKGIVIKEG